MPRRADIDDLDTIFEPDALAERQHRREQITAAAQEAIRVEEAELAAKQKRVNELSQRANESAILAEYRAAGVEPDRTPGKVLVSLSMLFKIGWRIEQVDGRKVLVAPAKAPGNADPT